MTRTHPDSLQARGDRLAEHAGDAIRHIGSTVEDKLQDAAASVAKTQKAIASQAQAVADAADEHVRKNPWRLIGIAAAVGILVGIAISARR